MARAIRPDVFCWRLALASLQFAKDLGLHFSIADSNLPGTLTRIREQAQLLYLRGITAENYYQYGLYRAELEKQNKRAYVGDFLKWRWFHRLNPPRYQSLTNDKLVFAHYAAMAEVPVPQTLAVLGVNGSHWANVKLRTRAEISEWFRMQPAGEFFLKPVTGVYGIGALSLAHADPVGPAWRKLPTGEPIDLDGVIAHLEQYPQHDFLVQPLLRSHPVLACLAQGVLHTVRVITLVEGDDVHILSATLRVGAGNLPVDNRAQGNIVAAVDLASGTVGAAYMPGNAPLMIRIDAHPLTGATLEGLRLPYWQESLRLIRRVALRFKFSRSLGWDLALTAEGPMIVEANEAWGAQTPQIAHDRGLVEGRFQEALRQAGANPGLSMKFHDS